MENFKRKEVSKYEKLLYRMIIDSLWNTNSRENSNSIKIKFLCIPSFTDYYLLQLDYNDLDFYWHRTTWKRDSDKKFLYYWMEFALEENQILPLELSCIDQEGKASIIQIQDLLNQLETFRIKPYLNSKNILVGRDGELIRLELLNQNTKFQVEWITSSTPNEWEELDTLTDLFYKINSSLL